MVEYESGEMHLQRIPHGQTCEECLSLLSEIRPWLSADEAATQIQTDNNLQDKVQKSWGLKYGGEERTFAEDEVHQEFRRASTVDAVLRGYTKRTFTDRNKGCAPDQLEVDAFTEECPITGNDLDVYYSLAFFERRVGSGVGQSLKQNCLPRQLYAEQGADTYGAMKNRSMDLAFLQRVKSQEEIDEQVKQIVADRAAVKLAEDASNGSVAQSSQLARPMSTTALTSGELRPAVFGSGPFSRERPSFAIQKGLIPSVPLFRQAGASLPPRANANAVSPRAASPCTPRDAPRPQRSASTPPHSGLGSPLQEPAHKRRVIGAGVGSATDGAASSRPSPSAFVSLSDFRGGSVSQVLSKLGGPSCRGKPEDDAVSMTSATTVELSLAKKYPTVPKYERPMIEYPVSYGWSGDKPGAALTAVKRAHTWSLNDGAAGRDYTSKLKSHLDGLTSASQFVSVIILIGMDLKIVYIHVGNLVPEHFSTLPETPYALLVARVSAEDFPPKSKDPKAISKGLSRLCPVGAGSPAPYDANDPQAYSAVFSEAALTTGAMANAAKELLCVSVYPNLVKDSMKRKGILLDLCRATIGVFDSLPQNFPSSSPYRDIVRDSKALLQLFGPTPFELGASMKEVEEMAAEKSALFEAIVATPACASVLSSSNYAASGESHSWPEVVAAVADLEAFSPDASTPFRSVVDKALKSMPEWKLQIREGALAATIQPRLIQVFELEAAHIQSKLANESASGNGDNATDVENQAVELLHRCKTANVEFKHANLTKLISSLEVVATKHLSSQRTKAYLQHCSEFIAATCEPQAEGNANVNELAAGFDNVLLEGASGQHLEMQTHDHRCLAWQALDEMSKLVWRSETLDALATMQVTAQRMVDTVSFPGHSEEFKKKLNDSMARITNAKNLIDLRNALTEYENCGDSIASRASNGSTLPKIKVLMAASDRVVEIGIQRAEEYGSSGLKAALEQLTASAQSGILMYGEHYCGLLLPPLKSEYDNLKVLAGGSSDGTRWSDHVPQNCTDKDFMSKTKNTLGAVDVPKLIAATKSTVMVSSFAYVF